MATSIEEHGTPVQLNGIPVENGPYATPTPASSGFNDSNHKVEPEGAIESNNQSSSNNMMEMDDHTASNGLTTSNGHSELNSKVASNDHSQSANPHIAGARVLEGKVALVTGAGRGIGAGIARELALKGASLVINYSSSAGAAEAVVKELEQLGGKAIAIKANITKPAEIEHMFQQAVDHFGRLDIVASNSGMEKFVPLELTTEEDFDDVFNLNTRAQFFVGKAAYKHMNRGGRLILMSSIATGIGVPGHGLYAGSKCAVEGFTRCFAADFGSKHCTVNAIAPAGVKSDMWATNAWRYAPGCDKTSSIEQIEHALANGSPLKRCKL